MDFTDAFDSTAIDYDEPEPSPLPFDSSPSVDTDSLERDTRRQEHISKCGSYFWRLDPHTRQPYSYENRCGYWRYCPRCFEDRVADMQQRADRCGLDAGTWLRCVITTVAHAKHITRKLGKDNYFRIPQHDSLVVLLFDSFNYPELQDLPEQVDLDDLDWQAIADTPERTKYTGNLGKEIEVEPEPYISVNMPVLEVTGLTDGQVRSAWDLALMDGKNLNPKYDVEELEFCFWILFENMHRRVKEMGGRPHEVTRRPVRVYEHQWRPWNEPIKVSTKRDNSTCRTDEDCPFGDEADVDTPPRQANFDAVEAELFSF